MKKIFTILCLSVMTLMVYGQGPVPNAGFENWSSYLTGGTPYPYELPDQWKTTDSITVANSAGATHSAIKENSAFHSGAHAIHLTSWSYLVGGFPILNGL